MSVPRYLQGPGKGQGQPSQASWGNRTQPTVQAVAPSHSLWEMGTPLARGVYSQRTPSPPVSSEQGRRLVRAGPSRPRLPPPLPRAAGSPWSSHTRGSSCPGSGGRCARLPGTHSYSPSSASRPIPCHRCRLGQGRRLSTCHGPRRRRGSEVQLCAAPSPGEEPLQPGAPRRGGRRAPGQGPGTGAEGSGPLSSRTAALKTGTVPVAFPAPPRRRRPAPPSPWYSAHL